MIKNKVLFVQKINDTEFETESLWCIKEGNDYVIDNIPFVAKRVALGDTIKVEYDKNENAYYFDDFVAVSENSTIRIYCKRESDIEDIRVQLSKFECESEVFLQRRIIAINVPKKISYGPIKAFLESGEQNNLWEYEESCLAHSYLMHNHNSVWPPLGVAYNYI